VDDWGIKTQGGSYKFYSRRFSGNLEEYGEPYFSICVWELPRHAPLMTIWSGSI